VPLPNAPILEFKPKARRSRRRAEPEQLTLFDVLAEAIDTVNSRAARRLPDASHEQDRLIDLLKWSIRMVEISKARHGAAAPEPEVEDEHNGE
jgi:hypothetical protein